MRQQGNRGPSQAPEHTCTQTGKKTEDLTADVHFRKKDNKPDSSQRYTLKGQRDNGHTCDKGNCDMHVSKTKEKIITKCRLPRDFQN